VRTFAILLFGPTSGLTGCGQKSGRPLLTFSEIGAAGLNETEPEFDFAATIAAGGFV
jgi:hypothetical protein